MIGLPVRTETACRAQSRQILMHANAQKNVYEDTLQLAESGYQKRQTVGIRKGGALHFLFYIPLYSSNI